MGSSNKKVLRDQYDYENAFDKPVADLDELFLEEMMKDRLGIHYATKTIISGKILEVEIYPIFKYKKDVPGITKDNSKAQNNLNDKNSRKRYIRVVNENFGEGDFWITLTYTDNWYPSTEKQAINNFGNYIRRVNRLRRKKGLGNARYVYIIEWEDEPGEKRCHFHVIMEQGIDRNTLEDMWDYAVINDTSRIHPNEEGITGLAAYMADKKKKKGKRRWIPSKNLRKPKESVRHYRPGKRKVEKMVRDYEEIREFFEKERKWDGYQFVDAEVFYNKFNCAFYIRIKARERSWENGRKRRKKREDDTGGGDYHMHHYPDSGGMGGHTGPGREDGGAGGRTGGTGGGNAAGKSRN